MIPAGYTDEDFIPEDKGDVRNCPRGHGVFGGGDHYTLVEVSPGLYEYVIGACEDLP